MNPSSLNSSQHVERIREILIGRDLQHLHGRLSRIEGALSNDGLPADSPDLFEAIRALRNEQSALRMEVQALKKGNSPANPASLLDRSQSSTDDLAAEMAERIDARFQEILSHFQKELRQWKSKLEDDLRSFNDSKVDRAEMNSRFSRLANAAMENQDQKHLDSAGGPLH